MEKSIKRHWNLPALTNYDGDTYQYKDIARKIAKIHILFESSNIKKGDKIAVIGRNSANWAVSYIAIITYGAVVVPILHEFKPDNLHHIVNHSEAKLLFVGDATWENLVPSEMINLQAIFSLVDFSLLYYTSDSYNYARENLNKLFGERYPKSFTVNDVNYYKEQSPDELAIISYTSGTTSASKGVMLPYRSLLSNLLFAYEVIQNVREGSSVVSLLPMAHMYGMAFEFLFEFSTGCHIYFLTRIPSPKVIFDAFNKIKPDIIIAVPLIVEKIYKKQILPTIDRPAIKALLKLPIIDSTITNKINNNLTTAFGGRFYEIIIGGAPLNSETEEFFKRMQFPYTVGYGMTECGPIITYADWKTHKLYSCGRPAPRMQVTIDSSDPANIVGEILTKGDNLMLGYFRNEAATKATFTEDGWLKTGDMGTMDAEGNLFIKGRSKNMILGSNGQNIYPEEIEDILNTMYLVGESLVLDRGDNKLEAYIYPDFEIADRLNLNTANIKEVMEKNRIEINKNLPAYSQISNVRVLAEEFEKTPKRSIKRFLYQISKD